MIIWITGISGSGKTTISKEIYRKYKKNLKNLVSIDGDIIRELYGNDLKYDIRDRIKQIKRIQKLSTFLERQDLVVLVTALYSNDVLLDWNRRNFRDYFEIYLDASIELVRKRDVKGLYAKFDKGLEKNIVGLDIPWSPPMKYDLKINMDTEKSLSETIKKISRSINIFK